MNRKIVWMISLWACVGAAGGCASEYNLATGREERLLYGTEKEVSIGDAVARQVEQNYPISREVDLNQRMETILDRLVPVVDRKDLVYTIRVIDEDTVNAVSLPGGYVYVFRGLIDKAKTDDQLAGVVAHELGHITARHGIKRMQTLYGYTLLQGLAIASQDADAVVGVNAIYTSVFLAYSRQDEFEADRLAVKYMKKAGYDPEEMIKVLEILKKEEERAPARPVSYFRTHPYLAERMGVVHQAITGELRFKDYLNLTGSEVRL
ncbi:MAG TPA: M48 family metallopeptidase [Candidatus Omnitrophota bacterium]|nr:M48 family metalloprotease [Candidatus Omnitrophota bacterium]HQO57191.1 M48 family metallopeptidase [Candidatus Omnitrophota bacterium]